MEDFGDISFGAKSGAVFMSSADGAGGVSTDSFNQSSTSPVLPTPFLGTFVSPWGELNQEPYRIGDDIRNTGVLAAALDAKARIGNGKGMQPFLLRNIDKDGNEDLEWVDDEEVHDWLEENESFEFGYDSSYDKHAYGWSCGSYVLNRGKNKIARVRRHDVFEARLDKKDRRTRRINNLYLCADWRLSGTVFNPDKEAKISLLEEGDELNDLQGRITGNSRSLEYGFINRTLRNGSQYYPVPTYRSGRAWISIARSVPAFKQAMFRNQLSIKYLVVIHPKFWEDKYGQLDWNKYTPEQKKEKRQEYHDKIDHYLAGENNAYKSIFTGGFTDSTGKMIPYVEITAIDQKIPGGEFLPDSGAANSEILFALMINPAMMGAGNPGGKAYGDTSGGSNVRESFLVQIMVMEAERRLNASVYNIVKKFNGWSKKLEQSRTIVSGTGASTPQSKIVKPRLVFRYPTGLLTTLDTGKSTKTETA